MRLSESPLYLKSSPEHQLLICCARTQPNANVIEQISHLMGQSDSIDWESLLFLAARHHLLPLLYWNLNNICPNKIPKPIFIPLWAHYESVVQKNQMLADELIRLDHLLSAHGISIIPYKGPTAAEIFYKNLSLREFSDLDFLVKKKDLSTVCNILEADGYRTKSDLNNAQRQYIESKAKEYLFSRRLNLKEQNRTETVCIEPHWSISMHKFFIPFDYAEFWNQQHKVNFNGHSINQFSPQDAILVYCVVGSKSQWKRLQMVSDLNEAVCTFPDFDWQHCLKRAQKLGCERMLLTAILLIHELFDAELPEEVIVHAKKDLTAEKLYKQIYNRFFQPVSNSVSKPYLFSALLWHLREKPKDKIHYLISTLTNPRTVHLKQVPLPKQLFFLYYFIVPIYDYLLHPTWKFINQIGANKGFRK